MGIKFSHGHSNSSAIYNNNNNNHHEDDQKSDEKKMEYDEKTQNRSGSSSSFKIPLHYPRYTKSDYEKMPEWQLDQLLREYGLPIIGDTYQKRKFAIGAFLWSPENDDH